GKTPADAIPGVARWRRHSDARAHTSGPHIVDGAPGERVALGQPTLAGDGGRSLQGLPPVHLLYRLVGAGVVRGVREAEPGPGALRQLGLHHPECRGELDGPGGRLVELAALKDLVAGLDAPHGEAPRLNT